MRNATTALDARLHFGHHSVLDLKRKLKNRYLIASGLQFNLKNIYFAMCFTGFIKTSICPYFTRANFKTTRTNRKAPFVCFETIEKFLNQIKHALT